VCNLKLGESIPRLTNKHRTYLYPLTFVTTRDGVIIINYKDIQDLMTSLTPLKLMDKENKKTVYNFVSKLVSKIYGSHLINKW
jgi:hypothetical protein